MEPVKSGLVTELYHLGHLLSTDLSKYGCGPQVKNNILIVIPEIPGATLCSVLLALVFYDACSCFKNYVENKGLAQDFVAAAGLNLWL